MPEIFGALEPVTEPVTGEVIIGASGNTVTLYERAEHVVGFAAVWN